MKKGLTIALLMVAMVALAASASAVAPIIAPLPAVIVGDVGDVSGVGTAALHLLRYENVFDLAAPGVVTRQSTTTANLSYYYVTTTSTLRASNAASMKQRLTTAEITALLAGTAPPAAKKINTSTDLWLSLIHDAGTTAPVSAKLATPAANGATTTALTTKGSLVPAVVTLYCTDLPILEAGKTGSGSFVVYSIVDANDEYSPIQNIANLGPAALGATPGHAGFAYTPGTAPDQVAAAKLETANGFGFTGVATLTGAQQGFASWSNGGDPTHATWVPALNSAGKIVRAQFTLTGTATDPLLTPGYRILFTSANFVHLGGYAVKSVGGTASGLNYPSNGAPVNTRLYWAAPIAEINHWADGGKAATFAAPTDERDYILYFDALQTESGDVGTLVLESLALDKIVRPPSVAPVVEWGGATGLPFTGWDKTTGPGAGWDPGVAVITAGSCTMAMAAASTTVFQQVNPKVDTPAALGLMPLWTSGKLIRMTATAAVTSMDTCPQIRLLANGITDAGALFGNTLWGVTYNPTPARFKNPSGGTAAGLMGSLKLAPTVYETYIYTQNGTVANSRVVPIIDILDAGAPIAGGWANPRGTITLSGLKMEVLN